jgi:hypothetical protein
MMGAPRSTFPIVILVAAIGGWSAGCAPRAGGDPATTAAIHKYEDWLQSQARPRNSGTAAPERTDEIVFVTDLQREPELGLSKVYLKSSPSRFYYVYNGQTDRLIWAAFSDGLAAIVVPVGRWGYIDESGRWVFAPIFLLANHFDRGVATAQLGPDAGDPPAAPPGAWVLLHKTEPMKALDPAIASVRDFSGDLAEFATAQRLGGYIDRNGAIKIAPTLLATRPFCSDGTAPVRTAGGWGLINSQGAFVVPAQYEDIHCFSEGLAAAKHGEWGFVDETGKFVIAPQFFGVGDFSEGLASFESRGWPNGPHYLYVNSYGFIDRTGSVVVPAKYDAVYPFKFGIAKAGTRRTNWLIYPLSFIVPADPHYTAWTYIDKRGHVVASDMH